MRRLAFLLPVVIVVVAAALWGAYRLRRLKIEASAPEKPALLEQKVTSTADDWEWSQTKDGKPQVQIKAHGSRYLKDSNQLELDQVELKMYQKDGKHYDLVKSPKAIFSQAENKMQSDGEVEITLAIPVDGVIPHQLTSIKSTGIIFDSKTGKANTDRPATFTFENGEGTCVGLNYDPDTHEMHMNSQVAVNLIGKGKRSKPMHVETETLVYSESGAVITLAPWSKLTRENTVVEAGGAVIHMKDRVLDTIDADHAHGVDSYPKRKLNYAADMLHLTYDEFGELQKMNGVGNARLTSVATGSETNVKANMVDMYFESDQGENVLRQAIANGQAVVETKPEPQPGGKLAETKIIQSESVEMKMRKGGHELEMVQSRVPATLELSPNQPTQHRRILHGAEMTIAYGPKNQIQSFRSTKVMTETFPLPPAPLKPGEKPKPPKPEALLVAHTTSDNLLGEFDPKTGQMKRMTQWGQFTYEEGERHSTGDKAVLENEANIMDIDKQARVWDASGATSGDHIRLAQNTGDFDAEGHVSTTRVPDAKKNESVLLDDEDPTLGSADHVWSTNKNRAVHYEGHAALWQTANRVEGDRVDIDRDKKILVAVGHVKTEFLDKDSTPAPDPKAAPAPQTKASAGVVAAKPEAAANPLAALAAQPVKKPEPKPLVYTVVNADKMVYMDATRLADYSGTVVMTRPNLSVKGAQLQAFLNEKGADQDSRLNHAIADGKVEIFDKALDRTRTSKGDHGEYYTEDSRIVIRGPQATLVDSKRGDTRGTEITYYSDDEKLVVKGAPSSKGEPAKPVSSRLRRKQ